ncbi:hypothetical protein KR009_005783 [Drosophila setifemur]|nr:hypothetical protein KR009_005783 [Drosophila setifemur]
MSEPIERTEFPPKKVKSQKALTVLYAISELVNTGLSRESLEICYDLINDGVKAQALAHIIKTIRKEVETTDYENQEDEDSGENPLTEADSSKNT